MPRLHDEFDASRPGEGTLALRLARARAQRRLFGAKAAPVTVGRFEIIDVVGSGGMGSVYSARDPKLDRVVALKFLDPRPGVGTVELRERLSAEARALAAVSHDNVVAVHSIEEDDDQVFIAMELVKGQTLRQWLAEERDLEAVVAVFAAIADALDAAHRHGVVHGDFKPENVMIEGGGRPRVLDFGLATTVATVTGVVHDDDPGSGTSSAGGTIAYAAPEQLENGTRDEHTDQFAFWITLLEALRGSLPPQSAAAETSGTQRGAAARSVQVCLAGAAPSRTAGQRRGAPARAVPRWLLSAAERGLSPDPDARWPSMADCKQALQGGGASRPLLWGAAALTVIAVAIAATQRGDEPGCDAPHIDAVWSPAHAARVAQAFAATERSTAAAAAHRATAQLDAWVDAWGKTYAEVCDDPNASADRDLAMACLLAARSALEQVVQTWEHADGVAVDRVDATLRALDRPRQCVEGDDETAVPDSLREVFARAKVLEASGRYQEGLEVITAVAGPAEAAGPEAYATYLYRLGELLMRDGEFEAAEAALSRCYELSLAEGDDGGAGAAAIYLVAVVGERQARHADGLEWGRHAQAALDRIGSPPSDLAPLENNLGGVHFRMAHYEQAAAHFERAAKLWTETLGPEAPDVAAALDNLGGTYASLARYDEALDRLRQALAIRERALGKDHPEAAASLHNIGTVLNRRGEYAEAKAPLQRALEIRQRALGEGHPRVGETLLVLGDAHDGSGDYDAAEAFYRRAADNAEQALPPDHPATATPTISLGNVAFHRGDPAAARDQFLRGLEIQRRALGENHPTYGLTRMNLAAAHGLLEEYDASAGHYRGALEVFETALGEDHPFVGSALKGLGTVQRLQGETDDAVATLQRALDLLARNQVPPISLADARATLARALWDQGTDRARALRLARQAREAFAGAGAPAKPDLAELEAWLIEIGELSPGSARPRGDRPPPRR